jgi:rod shape-determining protein MreC
MRAQTRTKSLFVNGSSLHIKLILCLGASLMFLAVENRGALTLQRQPFSAVVEPIRQAVSAPARMFRWFSESSATHFELVSENQRLREEALLLRGKQLRFEALQQENIRLRGLLDTTFKVGDQVLIVEPLSINVVPYENLIVVDKGSRYGIRMGQAVVDGNGVVGQVLRVTSHSADVVMITDPSHAIPVQVNRNGLRTIAMGTGQTDRLELPYLTSSADVRPGDLLVTSGLGGVFPAGYPVARITVTPSGTPGAGRFSASPVAQLDRNRELLVVHCDSTPLPRIPDQNFPSYPTVTSNADR